MDIRSTVLGWREEMVGHLHNELCRPAALGREMGRFLTKWDKMAG